MARRGAGGYNMPPEDGNGIHYIGPDHDADTCPRCQNWENLLVDGFQKAVNDPEAAYTVVKNGRRKYSELDAAEKFFYAVGIIMLVAFFLFILAVMFGVAVRAIQWGIQ